MRRVRRLGEGARLEMTPLIDVIFLLLTFFIYSLVLMVRVEALPVALSGVAGAGPAGEAVVNVVTVRSDGTLAWNREAAGRAEVGERMAEAAADPGRPTVYVAMEAAGEVDRAPALIELWELANRAGLERIVIVGTPESGAGGGAIGGDGALGATSGGGGG
ncbi:MAG: biopolymer transporter ExbD, partial [Planctomycetota bacterium]